MMDIVEVAEGKDLNMLDSIVPKAANVVGTQLGSLAYAPTFGVDLKYFLSSDLQFQNESFKAYLIQRLTEEQVNVTDAIDYVNTFSEQITFYVGDNNKNVGGLIR
jgi:hypothetical protein